METVKIVINGREVETDSQATILEAAHNSGIYIPSLCYYPDLQPLSEAVPDMACQLCLAEVAGKIVLCCKTKVENGMRIETETPRVREQRRINLTDILRRHPNACLTCDRIERCAPFGICLRHATVNERCVMCPNNQSCELQKVTDHIGIDELPSYTPKKLLVREDSPFFIRDHDLCILCQRCVRVCDELRGAKAIEWAFPCHEACPAGIDIPRYIRAIGRGRIATALAVVREKVPFPGVLGRVCIHPCESACQRGLAVDKPLQIRMLKRFASDSGDNSWKKQSKHLPPTGKRVAVVGSGPSGLTAAFYLAKLGHKVTVFEALPKPGGMMLVGIPDYRLPPNVLEKEINDIKESGVEIKLNTRITSVDSLFERGYNAVFLGLGAHKGMKLGAQGEDSPGVIEAVEFLRRGNLGERIDLGERVGVVGGGNVAIDAARMALRFGAKKVTIFYRRTRTEMPASPEEVEAVLEEHIDVSYLTAPTKATTLANGLVLECIRMKLGEPDSSGRARPIPVEGSEFKTELDTLLVAIGQQPEVPAELKVEVARNTIIVSADMQTSHKGVFSGGDCVRGPASVIEAIADGRKAAQAIDRYLGGKGNIDETLVSPEEATVFLENDYPEEKLAPVSHIPVEKRIASFAEVEQPWDWNTAVAEARRCLRCYVIAPPDEKVLQDANCQFCGACVDACPTGALIERSAAMKGTPDSTTTTTCPYCGVGCQLMLEFKDEKLVRVNPDPSGPPNRGQACVKGKFGLEFIDHPDRLTTPLIRKNGKLEKASWEEALELIAEKLSKYKPEEVGVIPSSRTSNEDVYVAQKFARAVLGTNNVDNCARI
jgi:formate dehydrogenase (NADP+) beta subunit